MVLGGETYAQEAFKTILVDKYNKSQEEYQLVVEFRPSVDSDMKTALAANQGPILCMDPDHHLSCRL